jgi:uncharacterized protein GlcG (DUF336 family)
MLRNRLSTFVLAAALSAVPGLAENDACNNLPNYSQLKTALAAATNAVGGDRGLNLQMWGTIVDRDGIVCAVAFTGVNRGAQWPGSRVISAQKANTANSFSLDTTAASGGNGSALALSTANLFSAVQPGGSLFGLQESNPVDTGTAYKGPSAHYGTANDPMVGEKIGGVNVFGGGLALYDAQHHILGGVGVSGDTSCADHYVAWYLRKHLNLDHLGVVIGGVNGGDPARPDNIIYDITPNPAGGTGVSAGGFGHPLCLNTVKGDEATLPAVAP